MSSCLVAGAALAITRAGGEAGEVTAGAEAASAEFSDVTGAEEAYAVIDVVVAQTEVVEVVVASAFVSAMISFSANLMSSFVTSLMMRILRRMRSSLCRRLTRWRMAALIVAGFEQCLMRLSSPRMIGAGQLGGGRGVVSGSSRRAFLFVDRPLGTMRGMMLASSKLSMPTSSMRFKAERTLGQS